jgi:hypothetical protein
LLATDRGVPVAEDIRHALSAWAFNKTRREAGPPAEVAAMLRWLAANGQAQRCHRRGARA